MERQLRGRQSGRVQGIARCTTCSRALSQYSAHSCLRSSLPSGARATTASEHPFSICQPPHHPNLSPCQAMPGHAMPQTPALPIWDPVNIVFPCYRQVWPHHRAFLGRTPVSSLDSPYAASCFRPASVLNLAFVQPIHRAGSQAACVYRLALSTHPSFCCSSRTLPSTFGHVTAPKSKIDRRCRDISV